MRTRTSRGLSPLYLACLRAPRLAILLMTNHPHHVTVALASSERPPRWETDQERLLYLEYGNSHTRSYPLHAVCLGTNDWSFRLDAAGMLLARGADPNAISIHRQTPLHFISPSLANPHSTRLIEMLLHHGASTCKTTVNGQTPIHYACLNYRLDWLKVMLPVSESEECINQPDRYGKTPISYTTRWAGTSRPIAVVKWLLAFGARRPRDPPFSPLWTRGPGTRRKDCDLDPSSTSRRAWSGSSHRVAHAYLFSQRDPRRDERVPEQKNTRHVSPKIATVRARHYRKPV